MEYLKLFALFYLCLFISLFACAQPDNESSPYPQTALSGELKKAYNLGKPLVLYAYGEKVVPSEAYADWEFYLKEFKQAEGKSYYYSKVNPENFASIIPGAAEFTLFLKKGHPAFFYKGFIVEPQVYTAIHQKFSDEPLTDVDRAFMPEELR